MTSPETPPPRPRPPGLRPLPSLWLHRTPTRFYYAPLDDDGDESGAASPRGGEAPAGSRGAGWLQVLHVLTRTDFRARYRGQALGVVWSVLYPLVMMGIMSLIFSTVFKSQTRYFPIFLLIGLVTWQWVTSSVSTATQCFVSHSDIVKRTVFPRQLLPMAMVLSYGLNFCIESMTLLFFIPIFPGAFRLSPALLLVPVLLVLLVLLLTGVALATSVLNVIYRDVAYIVNTGLLLLYWLTPVIYPVDVIPWPYRAVLQCNPLAGILHGLRLAVMEGQGPTALGWAGILVPTVLVCALGWGLFRRFERTVLDYV